MDLRSVLAANLKQLRKAAGMSQEELADAAQIDRTYMSSLERCRYAASVDVLERLAAALKVDPSLLFQKPSKQ
jgi:transcriptional regulator with XRE-family HTH domain